MFDKFFVERQFRFDFMINMIIRLKNLLAAKERRNAESSSLCRNKNYPNQYNPSQNSLVAVTAIA